MVGMTLPSLDRWSCPVPELHLADCEVGIDKAGTHLQMCRVAQMALQGSLHDSHHFCDYYYEF